MTKALVLLFVLLLSRNALARDTAFRISAIASMSAHGADLATTEFCLGAHKCTELNPFLARFDDPIAFGAAKMGMAALTVWLTARMAEKHPRWAVATNWTVTAVFYGIAAHNSMVTR